MSVKFSSGCRAVSEYVCLWPFSEVYRSIKSSYWGSAFPLKAAARLCRCCTSVVDPKRAYNNPEITPGLSPEQLADSLLPERFRDLGA